MHCAASVVLPALVVFTLLLHVSLCDNNNHGRLEEYLQQKKSHSASLHKRSADMRKIETSLLLENILDNILAAQKLQHDVSENEVSKRNSFWQPMGGPVPVETRFVSFGSRLEPEDANVAKGGIKAMRYGRRR